MECIGKEIYDRLVDWSSEKIPRIP